MFKRTKGFVGIILVIVLTSCTSSRVESDMDSQIILQTLTPANATARQPYQIEEVTEEVKLANPKTVYRQGSTVSGGVSWLAAKVDNGTPKLERVRYMLAYDQFGNLLSKELIPGSEELIPSSPIVYQYGARPQRGAVFFPSRITRYGADCGGCKPNENGESLTASGVAVSSNTAVRQMDGTLQDGILYEGYYVLASSSSLPLCTIVEISNHKFSGMGLKPGVPFKAIILDRGVSGRKLDLFVGTETNINAVREVSNMYPRATIIGFAEYTKNSMGQRICKVN
jgi:hypothetical protein